MALNDFKTFDDLLNFENGSSVTLARSVAPSAIRNFLKSTGVFKLAKPKLKKPVQQAAKRGTKAKI
jgi:hypothetical protein